MRRITKSNRLPGAQPGAYCSLWLDALNRQECGGGRTAPVSVMVAIGINAEGQREAPGIDAGMSEDGAC